MCTADPETSPTPSSSPKPSTDSPSSLPSTNTTQDTSMTPKRSETSANTGEEHSQHFDAASFVGGIILCAGIVAIAFFGWKFYKAGTEKPYQTLHNGIL
ncbi:hypothetical protein DPMN_042266 [Dreissena polymorpha]|uniref:Uncharacterized protein n=1 Tax=Dreissena polymorpha TaxID=45954 RepID=A0A9D4HYN2_DREPO|nr:hypothetical protein DPMN_042266 [Dreissena polymorpha]